MCGIFGLISKSSVDHRDINSLARYARQRGRDSSGLLYKDSDGYVATRSNRDILNLLSKNRRLNTTFVMGHSRLITNGLSDNQPVVRDQLCLIHNGIIVNAEEVWEETQQQRFLQIDSEAIIGAALQHFSNGGSIDRLATHILSTCKGTISCALALPSQGKLLLFSNNGSLFYGTRRNDIFFSSEYYPLHQLGLKSIQQVMEEGLVIDIPSADSIKVTDDLPRKENLIPAFQNIGAEEALLKYTKHKLRRCTKCILPETMPFIAFDGDGVCNYCNNYKIRNKPKPKDELLELLEPYRRAGKPECIVPFSGGRDSCWGLHLIIKELGLKPITYTYDWGMVTDLGRRNISRMCAELRVENIIVADDISKKRRNIRDNFVAWLKAPDLGMVSILTAGDKHFFRHVETVKRQTQINLNLWGINPLEVTHFKSGFLGVPPDFAETHVYSNGWSKQMRYQWLRLRAMTCSFGYFNRSLWDTISGEYYRSFTKKTDYFHVFDYWRWDEDECNAVLRQYDWELAVDTSTTWRIGDGTAAIYNYIYYTMAGFTEHDTFRSNQIREGQLTRNRALAIVEDENRPRYQNIKWYLDTLGLDYNETIEKINLYALGDKNSLFSWPSN